MKRVGIIGGLGPETTAEFYLNLIRSCQSLERTCRPNILISSVPIPYALEADAISRNIGMERIRPFLVNEARRLENAGADFIVMPCNSLHVFIGDIRNAVEIPVLSIVEETVRFLKEGNFKSVGIISTTATIYNKLYENAFKKNEILYSVPDAQQQTELGNIILNLVNGVQSDKDRMVLFGIVDSFAGKDVDCVVLACTDLQLLVPHHERLKIFDTMKIFAESTVKRILE